MNKVLQVCLFILGLAIGVPIVWEYAALRFGISEGFKKYGIIIIEGLRKYFLFIGRILGRLVSIIEWIEFERVIQAVKTVVSFYFQVLTSWWWTIIGFFSYISVLNHPGVYIVISVAVVCLILWRVTAIYSPNVHQLFKWPGIIVPFVGLSALLLALYGSYNAGFFSKMWINVEAWF